VVLLEGWDDGQAALTDELSGAPRPPGDDCGMLRSASYHDAVVGMRGSGRVLAVAAIIALAGCAAIPDGAWRLTPIAHDDATDAPPRPPDMTFPMRLVSDTAGGLWGESLGSWLHLDAEGATVRRFTLDGDEPRPVNGFTALSPDELLVSAATVGASGGIHRFDTTDGSWELLYSDQILLGDLAVHGDDVYVVAFTTEVGTFTIRRLPLEGDGAASDATPPLPWPGAVHPIESSVAIDIDSDGVIYVATQAEHIIVDADGTVRSRTPSESSVPQVAVGPDGSAVWSGGRRPSTGAASHVTDGSAEARAVLDRHATCTDDYVVVDSGPGATTLPFLCSPRGIAWLDAATFVASIGGEDGAVLVRVGVPAARASSG
jgi:hypothetical protein